MKIFSSAPNVSSTSSSRYPTVVNEKNVMYTESSHESPRIRYPIVPTAEITTTAPMATRRRSAVDLIGRRQ